MINEVKNEYTRFVQCADMMNLTHLTTKQHSKLYSKYTLLGTPILIVFVVLYLWYTSHL